MDPELLANAKKAAPRKVKFAPKGPPRRDKKPVLPKVEKVEDDHDDAQTQELLRRFNESTKVKPKAERKGRHGEVAFGSTIPRFGGSPVVDNYKSHKTIKPNKPKKEYKEPWDYYSYYPSAHPVRRPYEGDPEVLNEMEFGEDAEKFVYDENSTKAGIELDLMETNMDDTYFYFQIPATMPALNPNNNNNKSETEGGERDRKQIFYTLDQIPSGFIGKLLVHKNGDVKFKLGDVLYDASEDVDSALAQDIVSIDKIEGKDCSIITDFDRCVVITPDVDQLLDGILEDDDT